MNNNGLQAVFCQFFPKEIGNMIASYLTLREWRFQNKSGSNRDSMEIYMGPTVQIISIKQLTMKYIREMGKELCVMLFNGEIGGNIDEYDDEVLVAEDFVVSIVRFYAHPEDLLVYHCLSSSGDPCGILCTLNGKVITKLHGYVVKSQKNCPEEFRKMAKKFIKWYNEDDEDDIPNFKYFLYVDPT